RCSQTRRAGPVPSGWRPLRRTVRFPRSYPLLSKPASLFQHPLRSLKTRSALSESASLGETVEMVMVVAEAVLQHPRAFQEKADLVLVRHTDAAVHLDRFV